VHVASRSWSFAGSAPMNVLDASASIARALLVGHHF